MECVHGMSKQEINRLFEEAMAHRRHMSLSYTATQIIKELGKLDSQDDVLYTREGLVSIESVIQYLHKVGVIVNEECVLLQVVTWKANQWICDDHFVETWRHTVAMNPLPIWGPQQSLPIFPAMETVPCCSASVMPYNSCTPSVEASQSKQLPLSSLPRVVSETRSMSPHPATSRTLSKRARDASPCVRTPSKRAQLDVPDSYIKGKSPTVVPESEFVLSPRAEHRAMPSVVPLDKLNLHVSDDTFHFAPVTEGIDHCRNGRGQCLNALMP